MTLQDLRDQVYRATLSSKNFQNIEPVQRKALMGFFVQANEAQLVQVLQEFKIDEEEFRKIEAVEIEREKQRVLSARKLSGVLVAVEKEELRENAAIDAENSSKTADDVLMKNLSAIDKKPPRKKLFGIF